MGLTPTMPLTWEGETTDPSVSEPSATAHRLAATATAEPLLEPEGERSSRVGLRHCPPRADQPEDDRVERMLAHSERLVLPRMTAPAARSFATAVASAATVLPSSASEPAVVCMRSAVSKLSFTRMGMPWRGDRTRPAARSASSAAAMASASGLSSRTARSSGPRVFVASIRSAYCRTRSRAEARARPARVASTRWG